MENPRKYFGLAVFIFVFNKDQSKILLIKRNEEKRKKFGFDWGNIGGKVEPGEQLLEAAVREINEEIGLETLPERLKFLFFEEAVKKGIVSNVHFFYSLSIEENSNLKINHESDEFQWFSLDNLPQSMIDKPEKIKKSVDLINKGD